MTPDPPQLARSQPAQRVLTDDTLAALAPLIEDALSSGSITLDALKGFVHELEGVVLEARVAARTPESKERPS